VCLGDTAAWGRLWRGAESVDLPDARRLRGQPAVQAVVRELVAKIQIDCPRLVVLPGPQSIYFLAEVPTWLLRCRTAVGEHEDPEILALHARARERLTSGFCTLLDRLPPAGGEVGRTPS